MTGDGVDDVLLRWWNFTSNGALGELASVRPNPSGVEHRGQIPETVSRMVQLVSTPLHARPASGFLSPTEKDFSAPGAENHTLLDRWLQDGLTPDSLEAFQDELTGPSRQFFAQWKSGKTAVVSLPVLVALRTVSLLLQRPNPLFYRRPETYREMTSSGHAGQSDQIIPFDPRWILPTPSGTTLRAKLKSLGSDVAVCPAWVFTAGSYLPDLFGQCVVDNSASAWLSHDGLTHTFGQEIAPERQRGSSDTIRDPEDFRLFRTAELGVAFLMKKLLEKGLTYGSRRHSLLDRLTGPRSSKHLLGVSDHNHLRRFVTTTLSRRSS